MEFINVLIGTPLGYLMYLCLMLVGNYGVAILLFTLLTRVLLFPLSLLAQKNSILMVKMTPVLNDLQARHAGNKALIAEEQKKLYKEEHYSTLVGLLPLLIQIPIILGLIAVIYNPLTHLFHLDAQLIVAFIERTIELSSLTRESMGAGAELFALQAIQQSPESFSDIANSSEAIASIVALDTSFFGLDLMVVPTFFNPEFAMAAASAISALLLSMAQNRYNVLQATAGFLSRYGMMIFLIVFSGYFAFILPASLGLYWTATNLISIPILFLCNMVYSPKKYMTDEFKTKVKGLTNDEKKAKRTIERTLAKRSKAEQRRFIESGDTKELVFYSEASGFYKYYKGLISRILAQSDITIHYITSDPDDQVFLIDSPQFKSYYHNDKALISTLMRLNADVMVMTTPDLETYHLKRSLIRKDIEYIYLDHGMGSMNLMLREHALDHFDTVFCYGPNHVEEIREIEYAYSLPQKNLVKTGFELFDELGELAESFRTSKKESRRPKVLIAPSWQIDNIMECCGEQLVRSLLSQGLQVIVRPHPEYIKRFPEKVATFRRCFDQEDSESFLFQDDFSDNSTLYTADLLITDWSSIFMEFSYSTKQPVLFIDTTPKIANPNYSCIRQPPLDYILRNKLGVSLNPEDVDRAGESVMALLDQKETYRKEITQLFDGLLYEKGSGMQNGAEYIIGRILLQRENRG